MKKVAGEPEKIDVFSPAFGEDIKKGQRFVGLG